MCYKLAEAGYDTVHDVVDQVRVSHLGMDIECINIVQGFLDSACMFEIPDVVKSPMQLAMVTIVLLNGILDFFTSIQHMLVRFPPF